MTTNRTGGRQAPRRVEAGEEAGGDNAGIRMHHAHGTTNESRRREIQAPTLPRRPWSLQSARMRCLAAALSACLFAAAPTHAAQPRTWEQNAQGEWSAVPTTAPADLYIDNPTLDRIEQQLAGGRAQPALDDAIGWIKSNPDAPDRDRGLFLLAEAYRLRGDRIRAFYHLDELMDYYPESRLFYPALEKQFSIADDYLNGYKRRVFGFLPVGAEEEGVEMLYRIQERSPGAPIAERSLLRTADYYYDSSQFDLATDAYSAYLRAYPRSPEVPRVKLFRAFSSLAQFRGLRFDATPLIDAKARLEDVLAQHPDLARQENAREFIDRIDRTIASKIFVTADFYRRTNEPRAAVYLWRYLVQTFPDSEEAARSQQELAKAPAGALDAPDPAKGRPEEELPTIPEADRLPPGASGAGAPPGLKPVGR
jgi:outer membrane assembly lipoprotein YfiO